MSVDDYREQPGWPQPHEISIDDLASSQRWLQYFLSSGTVHLQAGWAHFFCSVSVMENYPFFLRAPDDALNFRTAKLANVDLEQGV